MKIYEKQKIMWIALTVSIVFLFAWILFGLATEMSNIVLFVIIIILDIIAIRVTFFFVIKNQEATKEGLLMDNLNKYSGFENFKYADEIKNEEDIDNNINEKMEEYLDALLKVNATYNNVSYNPRSKKTIEGTVNGTEVKIINDTISMGLKRKIEDDILITINLSALPEEIKKVKTIKYNKCECKVYYSDDNVMNEVFTDELFEVIKFFMNNSMNFCYRMQIKIFEDNIFITIISRYTITNKPEFYKRYYDTIDYFTKNL